MVLLNKHKQTKTLVSFIDLKRQYQLSWLQFTGAEEIGSIGCNARREGNQLHEHPSKDNQCYYHRHKSFTAKDNYMRHTASRTSRCRKFWLRKFMLNVKNLLMNPYLSENNLFLTSLSIRIEIRLHAIYCRCQQTFMR